MRLESPPTKWGLILSLRGLSLNRDRDVTPEEMHKEAQGLSDQGDLMVLGMDFYSGPFIWMGSGLALAHTRDDQCIFLV